MKSKYDPDTFPLLAEGWAREGLTEKQIAKNLGVSERSFQDYKKKYPLFLQYLKKGQGPVDFEVENALYKRATGYDAEERTTEDKIVNGKVVKTMKTVIRHIPPSEIACFFWLKNRKPHKWRDKPDAGGGDNTLDEALAILAGMVRVADKRTKADKKTADKDPAKKKGKK